MKYNGTRQARARDAQTKRSAFVARRIRSAAGDNIATTSNQAIVVVTKKYGDNDVATQPVSPMAVPSCVFEAE